MIVDIYARLSHDKRAGGDLEGVNVDDQISRCSEWIVARGDTVGEIYRDDSISATSGVARPDFERLLTEDPRPVAYLKQSRLERDPGDLERFLLAGREGFGLDGTRATLETAGGEFLAKMMSLVGRFEQRNKAEFQRAANLRIAKSGHYRGSIRPFGQDRTGKWIQPEADAVRTAASDLLADNAVTFYTIAKRWNDAGLLTPQTGKQGGKQWTSGTVRNYFTRPRLYGVQDYQGTLYPLKDWTPLLDKATFDELQILIEAKRTGKRGISKGRGDAHELTGIAKCECGRGMNIGYRGAKGTARTYRCPTVGHQSVTAEHLERTVRAHTLHLLSAQEENKSEADEASTRIRELLTSKRTLEASHLAWIDEAVTAGLSPSLIAKRESVHAEESSKIDAEVLNLRQGLGVNLLLTEVNIDWEGGLTVEQEPTGWKSLPVAQRRDVLSSLFTGIHLARGKQGARFDPNRVTYSHTDLGERLWHQWAENWSPLEALGQVP